MIVRFSDDFTKYTNGLSEVPVECEVLGEGLSKVFEMFPQLYVHLMDNQGEMSQKSAIIQDGVYVDTLKAIFKETAPTTELIIGKLIPFGADGDNGFFRFIDPLGNRLASGQQIFGMQGYGWTMPGANNIMSQQDADRLAGYAMQTIGYAAQYVGSGLLTVFGWTGIGGLIGIGLILAGSMFVMMGNWSLDAAGNVYPTMPKSGLNNSAVYTFLGIKNTTASGTPFQIVYGEHRIGGHVLNMYTETETFKKVTLESNGEFITITSTSLYAQIGLCEGEIQGVTEIEVNKLPLNYYNEVYTAPDPDFIRLGTRDQDPMPLFKRIENTNTVSRLVMKLSTPLPPAVPLDAASFQVYGAVFRGELIEGPRVWVDLDPPIAPVIPVV